MPILLCLSVPPRASKWATLCFIMHPVYRLLNRTHTMCHWWCLPRSSQWRQEWRVSHFHCGRFYFCWSDLFKISLVTPSCALSYHRMDSDVHKVFCQPGQAAANSRLLHARLRQTERRGKKKTILQLLHRCLLVQSMWCQPGFVVAVTGSGEAEERGRGAARGWRGLGEGHKGAEGHEGSAPQWSGQQEDSAERDREAEEERAAQLLHLAAQKHTERTWVATVLLFINRRKIKLDKIAGCRFSDNFQTTIFVSKWHFFGRRWVCMQSDYIFPSCRHCWTKEEVRGGQTKNSSAEGAEKVQTILMICLFHSFVLFLF